MKYDRFLLESTKPIWKVYLYQVRVGSGRFGQVRAIEFQRGIAGRFGQVRELPKPARTCPQLHTPNYNELHTTYIWTETHQTGKKPTEPASTRARPVLRDER